MKDKELLVIVGTVLFFIGFMISLMFFQKPNCSVDFDLLEQKIDLYMFNPEELPLGVHMGTDLQELSYVYKQYPHVKNFVYDMLMELVSCK